jgi:hypothetical protein
VEDEEDERGMVVLGSASFSDWISIALFVGRVVRDKAGFVPLPFVEK